MVQNFLCILDISTKSKPDRLCNSLVLHAFAWFLSQIIEQIVRKLNIFQFETALRGSILLVKHQVEIPFTNRINLY